MEYSRREVNQDRERDIVIGLIVSDQFIKEVLPLLKPEYFALPYSRTVAKWCTDFYNNYSKAPDKEIMSVFESKKVEIRDQSVIETIEIFLTKLSDRFEAQESFNVGYNVDRALNYFKERSIDLMIERVKVAKLSGDLNRAEAEISGFKKIAKGFSNAIEVWEDTEACLRAVRDDDKNDILFPFPGELGNFIRPLKRQEFAAVLSPSGRGKTWFLNEIAFSASLEKLNVVYYSFEMTEQQTLQRFYQRITGQLEPSHKEDDDGEEIIIPSFDVNFDITKKINLKKEYRKRITARTVMRQMASIQRMVGGKRFKLICEPSGSMSVDDLNTSLDNLESTEDFIPDVILIDYADIMKHKSGGEKRFQLDETWMGLRAISQARNCCVFTVSHTNKTTFDRDIKQGDYSEASVKSNHLTLAIALNQNDEDRDNSAVRLSIMKDRFKKFNPKHEIMLLQCLDIGQVFLGAKRLFKNKTGE